MSITTEITTTPMKNFVRKIRSVGHIIKGLPQNGSLNTLVDFINSILRNILGEKYKIYQKYPRRKLKFEIMTTQHCNLNCVGCSNFASIAEEGFIDLHTLENDLSQIKKIDNNKIQTIFLTGGEPLLHPNLSLILEMINHYFPYVNDLYIVTNGLLLMKQNDNFWTSVKKNRFRIEITRYPISLPYKEIEEKAKKNNVEIKFYGSTVNEMRIMEKTPLNNGTGKAKANFMKCHKANTCVTLHEGKIFTCTLIPRIYIFNKFFNKDFVVLESDFIDIYKVTSINNILKKLNKSVPFCNYCDVDNKISGISWERTKKDITEWT